MKKFLMMAALMVATLTVSAQDYNWAVGARAGAFSGLTVKNNNGSNAIEIGASWDFNQFLSVFPIDRFPLALPVWRMRMLF